MTGPDPRTDVIVIGSGVDELVAAAYLARAGLAVLVLQPADRAGGTAVTEELIAGFRFDSCADDAGWLPERIVRELGLGGLERIDPDPTLLAPRPGEEPLVLRRDPMRTRESIRGHSARDAGRWDDFVARTGRFADTLARLYAGPPPRPAASGVRDIVALLDLGRRLRGLGRTEMLEFLRALPMPVQDLLEDWFESDALKAALGGSGILGLFQGPRSAGTGFVFLHHHVGGRRGHFGPRGLMKHGVGGLAAALVEAAARLGTRIRSGAPVARILVEDGRAGGVALESGEELAARAVLSGADCRQTFLRMLDPVHLEPEFVRAVGNIRFRGATARVHLALGALPRFDGVTGDEPLRAGIISLGDTLDDLERAYDDAKHGGVSRRPFLRARIPSLEDPSRSPPGKHAMSVSVHYAPYLVEGGWDAARREALGDLVVDTLTGYAPDLPGLIQDRRVLTPADLERDYGRTEGQLYQGEMALDQVLFMRPVPGWADYRTPVRDLYLCGPGTHPGGAIAGASGRNAARALIRDLRADD